MTRFETTNSVFVIADENNSFSISIPGCWRIPNYLEDEVFDKLKSLLTHRPQNDIESDVGGVRRRGKKIEIGDKDYKITDLNTSEKETFEELKNATYHDLEALVYRMGLIYDEILDVLDKKHFPREKNRLYLITWNKRTKQY